MTNPFHTCLLGLCALPLLASAGDLEARDALAGNNCAARSPILSKLSACSTGTAFCKSYLGYTGAAPTVTSSTVVTTTSTSTKVITSKTTSTSATVPPVTSGVTTATASATTKIVTVTSNAVCTGVLSVTYEYDGYYYGGGDRAAVAAKSPVSCGLRGSAIGAVSTGCSCFIDPTTTATSTKVRTATSTATAVITKTTTIKGPITVPSKTVTTTPTSTSTVTVTETPLCPVPDTTCLNFGLQWAYYPAKSDTSNTTDPANIYSPDFEPALSKTVLPSYDGTTGEMGGFEVAGYEYQYYPEWDVYGEYLPDQYMILNHRGYFFAPQDGTYTFEVVAVDDHGYLWIGDLAYSGWDAANADQVTDNEQYAPYYATLVGGTYYAFRFYYAQGNGPGALEYGIIAPDGTIIADSDSTPSEYFVQYSCDGTAPAYPMFGKET